MPALPRALQSAIIGLRFARLALFDRDYRAAQRWVREGFAIPPVELEARQMRRLRELIAGFRRIGLCSDAAFEDADSLRTRADLARLPLLTRPLLQELYPRLREVHAGRRLFELSTTGTTGIPVRVLRDRAVMRANEGCYIELAKVMGYRPSMTHLVVWSNNDAIGLQSAHYGRFSRLLYPREVFRSLKTDAGEFRRLHSAIMASRGCCVSGYTGMLALYATQMQKAGLSVPPGQVACLCGGAEMLGPRERAVLEATFHVRAFDMYGSREIHQAAWDCPHGNYHINPRLIAEAVDPQSGAVLPEGEVGLLVFSDLFNAVTPIIRYQVGDYGAVERIDNCPCGRRGWALRQLMGRAADLIHLSDGTVVTPMIINPLLYLYPQVENYQLQRLALTRFRFSYCGEALESSVEAEIRERLSKALSGAEVEMQHGTELPVTSGGKLSYYVDLSQE